MDGSRAWLRTVAGWLLLGASLVSAAPQETLVSLELDRGAVQPYLLDRDDAHPPWAVALLFTGGGGHVGLLGKGIPRPGANFLVRERARFNTLGVATAVIDVPDDLAQFTDGHRMSRRHADDVAAVLRDLRARLPGRPVFLVGTSRGTVSAAHAGAALGAAVDGVVLSSSVVHPTRGGNGLTGFDYDSIRAPLLFVHHVDDGCVATPYAEARRVAAGRALVSVSGGDPPRSDACEPFSPHGYLGVEGPTVQAIVRWMGGEPAPAAVP